MFDTLDERIRHDEAAPTKVRVMEGIAIAVISILLFGGLYFVVRLAE
jgi:hypothetical protein